MVKLNKIYTRTGDDGTTALVSGPRRVKHDLRVESYGTVDETNSAIGIARLHTLGLTELDAMLFRAQNDLFDLGADLATPHTGEVLSYEPLRIIDAQVTRLENEIDALNADLATKILRSSGGTPAAAYLHLARTISRRAERQMVELSKMDGEVVSAAALKYINRLSDFLFVAARFANDAVNSDVPDILWVPGKNR